MQPVGFFRLKIKLMFGASERYSFLQLNNDWLVGMSSCWIQRRLSNTIWSFGLEPVECALCFCSSFFIPAPASSASAALPLVGHESKSERLTMNNICVVIGGMVGDHTNLTTVTIPLPLMLLKFLWLIPILPVSRKCCVSTPILIWFFISLHSSWISSFLFFKLADALKSSDWWLIHAESLPMTNGVIINHLHSEAKCNRAFPPSSPEFQQTVEHIWHTGPIQCIVHFWHFFIEFLSQLTGVSHWTFDFNEDAFVWEHSFFERTQTNAANPSFTVMVSMPEKNEPFQAASLTMVHLQNAWPTKQLLTMKKQQD